MTDTEKRSISGTSSASFAKKRGRVTSPSLDPTVVPQWIVQLQAHNLTGCATLLAKDGDLSTVAQAAARCLQEQPPWVHWSKTDQASNHYKMNAHKIALTAAFRGYRMARANQGVSQGTFYYEVILQSAPTAEEILQQLPHNARLGPGLQQQLQEALQQQQQQSTCTPPMNPTHPVGGHWRIGWSMRTGDLQAAVGYDKWSYGIRTLHGSIVHQSKRIDDWQSSGTTSFVTGDVVGCLIHLQPEERHIRFFRNGQPLGDTTFKGKRLQGGEAFTDLEDGVYYPAVSGYMGGTCKANFGPFFVYPPEHVQVQPMMDRCPPPMTSPTVLTQLEPVLKLLKQPEQQELMQEAVQTEVDLINQTFNQFMDDHLADIRQERLARGLPVEELPHGGKE